MIDLFERLHAQTAVAVAGLQPDGLSVAEADGILAALSAMAALVSAGELLVMGRAVEGDTMHAAKVRLARRGGISGSEVESLVKASRALDDLPVVADALRAGRLSRAQARTVIDTATDVPSAQSAILDAAATEDLKGLRDRCASVRAKADRNPAATRDRHRRARTVRVWTGRDGCHHGQWCLPPEAAAEFEGTLQQWVDQVLRHAPDDGDPATIENRRADALIAMARASVRPRRDRVRGRARERSGDAAGEARPSAHSPTATKPAPPSRNGTGPPAGVPTTTGADPAQPPGASALSANPGSAAANDRPEDWLDEVPLPIAKEVVVVIDIITFAAAMTGTLDHLEPDRDGQLCELRGFGPVAPQVAQLFMEDDPFLKVVLTEGCDVRIVKHFGRRIPAHFLTGWRLTHRTCADPGCNNCRGLEGDHVIPDALDGPISMATFEPKCRTSHREKTKADITAIAMARANGFQKMTDQQRAAHNTANRKLAFDPSPDAYQRFLDLEAAEADRPTTGTTKAAAVQRQGERPGPSRRAVTAERAASPTRQPEAV